jgi:hypothetical protein
MIEFKLDPIENVQPWGNEGDKKIHWFALTQGLYRIKVGDEYLLNYNKEFDEYLHNKHPEYNFPSTTFVDYYVVRLWEDIISALPYILKPLPQTLKPIVQASVKWQESWRSGFDIDEKDYEYTDFWLFERHLNSHYLQNAPNIWFWSDEENVFIHWDSSEIYVEGIAVWSAIQGSHKISRNEFIENIWSFHSSFIAEMGKRVEWICSNFDNSGIFIDFEQLQKEHKFRKTFLEPAKIIKPNTEPIQSNIRN